MGKIHRKVKHVDGIADVIAIGYIFNNEFIGEYKFQGMTYGVTIPEKVNPICQGSCSEHLGEIKDVEVQGWGNFNYCLNAIKEDRRRGLTVND